MTMGTREETKGGTEWDMSSRKARRIVGGRAGSWSWPKAKFWRRVRKLWRLRAEAEAAEYDPVGEAAMARLDASVNAKLATFESRWRSSARPYGCTYPHCKERVVGEPFVSWCKGNQAMPRMQNGIPLVFRGPYADGFNWDVKHYVEWDNMRDGCAHHWIGGNDGSFCTNCREERESPRALAWQDYSDEITPEQIAALNRVVPDREFADWETVGRKGW